jgi:molecular chaperone DnaK (HSP70)
MHTDGVEGRSEPARPAPEVDLGAPCPHCKLWETTPADNVPRERLILTSGLTPERELLVTNDDVRPHQVILLPADSHLRGIEVEPAGAFDLPAGGQACVVLRLDEERLPRDLQVEERSFVLVVDNDKFKTLPVPVTVKAGPRPVLLTPALQFGELAEGRQAVRQLELRNAGGIPLRLREVRGEGSSQLALAPGTRLPVILGSGERVSLPVAWDTRRPEEGAAPAAAGLRLSFDNYAESLFVPASARLFRFGLEFDPTEIRRSPVLSGQDYIEKVTLTNTGTIDIEVTGIESDKSWIKVLAAARSFTLRCRESLGPAAPASATAGESLALTLAIHPKELPAGPNQASVSVLAAGHERRTLKVELNVFCPEASPDYLGIDFGTSNSVVAFFDEGAKAPAVLTVDLPGTPASGAGAPSRRRGARAKASGTPLIPSVLAFAGGPDAYRIGHEAQRELNVHPDWTVRSIKRIMGYAHQRQFFGRAFSPAQLATLIIKKLVQLAEERHYLQSGKYLSFKHAIFTVPANFFDLQIRDVLAACEAAGLDIEEESARLAAETAQAALGEEVNAGIILDEPSAAALYYLDQLEMLGRLDKLDQPGKRLNLLVFDYGGGTLDVSVASVERLARGAGLRILANMGNNQIGGDSIDLALMFEMVRRCKGEVPAFDDELIRLLFKELDSRSQAEGWRHSPAFSQILAARNAWKDAAERAKILLSDAEQTRVELPAEAIPLRIAGGRAEISKAPFFTQVTRAEFETQIKGILVECEGLVEKALDLAGVKPEEIDFVLHTGRQSLLPAVRERVKKIFAGLPAGNDLLEEEHLKVCVAKGAVIYGRNRRSLLAEAESGVHFLSGGRRLPHSYGVEKVVGLLQREFDEIVKRGQTYPWVERRRIPESMIGPSGWLNLKFYQNAGKSKVMRNNPEITLIGQVTFDSTADGKPGCEVKLTIDANRKLEVSADGILVPIVAARLQGEETETWLG